MSNTPMLCCWVGVIIWRGTFVTFSERASVATVIVHQSKSKLFHWSYSVLHYYMSLLVR